MGSISLLEKVINIWKVEKKKGQIHAGGNHAQLMDNRAVWATKSLKFDSFGLRRGTLATWFDKYLTAF